MSFHSLTTVLGVLVWIRNNFSSWTHSAFYLSSYDKKKKQSQQNSTQRKDNKVGNKTCCKKGWEKEKKRMREKNENRCLPPPKKTKFVSKCSKHKKKLLNYIQLAENLLKLSVKISFLAIPMLTSQKLLQKWGSGQKCCFFVTKMVILKS